MTERKLSPRDEFDKALAAHARAFGVRLGDEQRSRLGDYFQLVSTWNKRLHLVAPCPPAEFATRHVLESLLAARHVTEGATVVDVGSGAGLPAIPCIVIRPDIKAVLVESSKKKAVFLREALSSLGRSDAARVVAERFEKTEPPAADFLTCRALERFTDVLPHLVKWAAGVPTLLLFGGTSLKSKLDEIGLLFDSLLIPESESRFLFVVSNSDSSFHLDVTAP